jgi:hypothetical protein
MQDDCENCHFSSIGGLDARDDPKAPDYVSQEDREAYLRGYIKQAKLMYGEDWRTCKFTWQYALTINPKED